MIVRARVNQLDAAQLRIDGQVMIHLDAYPDVSLPGKVLTITALAQNTGVAGKSKAFVVTFSINGSDPRLFPDISANVDVVVEQVPNALLVPRGAVVLQAASRDRGFVFVQDARNGAVKAREVTLGTRSDTHWAVTGGLTEGEKVAAVPPANATAMIGSQNGNGKPVSQVSGPVGQAGTAPSARARTAALSSRFAGSRLRSIKPRRSNA